MPRQLTVVLIFHQCDSTIQGHCSPIVNRLLNTLYSSDEMIRPDKQLEYKFCLMYVCPVIHKSIFVYYYSKTNLKGVVEGIQRGGLGFTFISTLVVSLFFIFFLTRTEFTCSQFISSLSCCTHSAFAANFKIETVKGYSYLVLN